MRAMYLPRNSIRQGLIENVTLYFVFKNEIDVVDVAAPHRNKFAACCAYETVAGLLEERLAHVCASVVEGNVNDDALLEVDNRPDHSTANNRFRYVHLLPEVVNFANVLSAGKIDTHCCKCHTEDDVAGCHQQVDLLRGHNVTETYSVNIRLSAFAKGTHRLSP